MAMFSKELGIDLGTMFTRIVEGDQVLVEEPTVVAIDFEEQKMVEFWQAALNMMGRVSDVLEVERPLHNGVVAFYEYTQVFLQELLEVKVLIIQCC